MKKIEQRKTASRLKVIPLGGLEQIGLNITAFEYEDSIIVVDCGLSFPEDEMLGIDLVIPDITYLKEHADKVKGFVITHGHEDHIGALPYVLKDLNIPVYATRLTMGIIENKLAEHDLTGRTRRKVVKFGQSINLGQFRVEFIRTNHSIVDAAALAIYSPAGVVIHTGDFKVDYTPVFGDAIDLQRFAELGKKGVLALMCDSTNAERLGFTASERTVGRTFDSLFAEHRNTRIIIATFASNVDRVQQIINSAYKHGRKVVVEGRSMVNIIETASGLECLHIPENTLIDIEQLKDYPNDKTVIITTGSQGESMAALSRMASDNHRKISILPGDTVIFSSHPIPGNEKAVTNVINELLMKGADVIFQDVHVSGHACQEEIKLIYSLVKPKYAIPIHGEYKHRKAQAKVAAELGISKENIFMIQSGDVLEMDCDKAEVTGRVPVGAILVDGLGVGDVGNVVLRDRQHLAEDGILIVVLALDSYSDRLVSGPDIVSRGFVYVRESDELLDEARYLVDEAVHGCLDRGQSDWGKLKSTIKDVLSEFGMEEDETASYDLADYHGSIEGVCFQEDKVWHRRNDSMTEKDVMEAARRLAGIIRETDIYKEYLQCREIMRKQPELYAQVNEYRLKNFDIQNESEGSELFDRMEAFEREYREFRENPMVDDFLRAELALCRMVQEMNVLLTAEIDFE